MKDKWWRGIRLLCLNRWTVRSVRVEKKVNVTVQWSIKVDLNMSKLCISHLWCFLLAVAACNTVCCFCPPPCSHLAWCVRITLRGRVDGIRWETGGQAVLFFWGWVEGRGRGGLQSVEVDVLKCCECVLEVDILWADTVDSWIASSSPDGFTPSEGTSHADACKDGDNQPPPDTHQLLFDQERQ